jgi:hypothetical protein
MADQHPNILGETHAQKAFNRYFLLFSGVSEFVRNLRQSRSIFRDSVLTRYFFCSLEWITSERCCKGDEYRKTIVDEIAIEPICIPQLVRSAQLALRKL